MKTQCFLAGILCLLITGCSLGQPKDVSPIREFELTTSTLPGTQKICFKPSKALVKRCQAVGGELFNTHVNNGWGTTQRYGCYPVGTTTDALRPCTSDNMCQGRCIWQDGDYHGPEIPDKCSFFKKPYFSTVEEINGYFWCDEEATWPTTRE